MALLMLSTSLLEAAMMSESVASAEMHSNSPNIFSLSVTVKPFSVGVNNLSHARTVTPTDNWPPISVMMKRGDFNLNAVLLSGSMVSGNCFSRDSVSLLIDKSNILFLSARLVGDALVYIKAYASPDFIPYCLQ